MFKGSCLCGRVTFDVHGDIFNPRYCHCANCRKFAGTGPAAWGMIRTETLEITSAETEVTRFDSGGGLRVFCRTCGSPLWYEPTALSEYRGIALGAIDEGSVPAPGMHLWTKSKPSWVSISDALPQFETHPSRPAS